MTSRAEEKRIRAKTRAALVAVAKAWGEERGVPVAELLFRLKTAPVREEPARPAAGAPSETGKP